MDGQAGGEGGKGSSGTLARGPGAGRMRMGGRGVRGQGRLSGCRCATRKSEPESMWMWRVCGRVGWSSAWAHGMTGRGWPADQASLHSPQAHLPALSPNACGCAAPAMRHVLPAYSCHRWDIPPLPSLAARTDTHYSCWRRHRRPHRASGSASCSAHALWRVAACWMTETAHGIFGNMIAVSKEARRMGETYFK